MTEVYCRTCEEFTPLALEDMQKQPNKEIVAGSLVCPQCYSILLTLKVDEEGIYTFQQVAALEVSRPLPQETEEVKVSTETNQARPEAPPLRLVP
jgi:hypothetical protein